ncbi:Uncharacterised protein [Vibrio cholerae]|nr:Uncharacterised protein [Vibrio cholerae]
MRYQVCSCSASASGAKPRSKTEPNSLTSWLSSLGSSISSEARLAGHSKYNPDFSCCNSARIWRSAWACTSSAALNCR